ncbi:MAG: LysE family transporter, partial [Paracoccaceae bacterium]
MPVLLSGLGLSLSLIAAIGAQNVFVLRQGLRREHVLPVVLFCAISDAILIGAGVAGIGLAAENMPALLPILRWGGVVFLG